MGARAGGAGGIARGIVHTREGRSLVRWPAVEHGARREARCAREAFGEELDTGVVLVLAGTVAGRAGDEEDNFVGSAGGEAREHDEKEEGEGVG